MTTTAATAGAAYLSARCQAILLKSDMRNMAVDKDEKAQQFRDLLNADMAARSMGASPTADLPCESSLSTPRR